MTTSGATERPGSVRTQGSSQYDASVQHLALINSRREHMYQRMLEAEDQMLHRLAVQYRAGALDRWDLAGVLDSYRQVASPGYTKRWDAVVPVSCHALFGVRAEAARRAAGVDRHLPNGPEGTWRGINPVGYDEARPPDGTPVVYVLYDDRNVPCYVGSTARFDGRIRSHRREKSFSRWLAYPCADRSAAYRLERRLLREFQPYLNLVA